MKITICGCGWVGSPAAAELVLRGHQVTGTKRNLADLPALESKGISALAFQLGKPLKQDVFEQLIDCDVFLFNIPCGRKRDDHDVYVAQVDVLLEALKSTGVKHILHLSTTSVYGGLDGTVTDTNETSPLTPSAKTNLEIEKRIMALSGQHAILRLAGLVGEDRHPAKFLSGKADLVNPDSAVNLVHRRDVIAAIVAIIEGDKWGDIYHLCSTEHPSRSDYYTKACNKLGLTPPTFSDEQESSPRVIDATESIAKLGISLSYPSPYDML